MTDEILRRFRARLIKKVGLAESAVFIADAPQNLKLETAPDQGAIVSTDGATYNSDEEQSLALLKRTEYVDVTLFNRLSAIDESGVARSLVAKSERNLYAFETDVLRQFVGWRLGLDGAPEIMINSTVKATRRGRVEILSPENGGRFVAFLPLTFQVSYQVDLCQG